MRWLTLVAAFVVPSAFAETITGTVTKVIDGDTLVVHDAAKKRYKIRLAEIDAPEEKQPFWMESSRSLAELCYKKEAKVEWSEKVGKSRYLGYVTCAGKDVNAEQLKRGMAWGSPKSTKPTSALYELEAYARLRKVGLWADENPVAPWQWAKQKP